MLARAQGAVHAGRAGFCRPAVRPGPEPARSVRPIGACRLVGPERSPLFGGAGAVGLLLDPVAADARSGAGLAPGPARLLPGPPGKVPSRQGVGAAAAGHVGAFGESSRRGGGTDSVLRSPDDHGLGGPGRGHPLWNDGFGNLRPPGLAGPSTAAAHAITRRGGPPPAGAGARRPSPGALA